MTDKEVKGLWGKASRLFALGSSHSLSRRIALMYVDDLEKAGVTEEDINRLFPLSPIQVWLRDSFVDPCAA